MELLLKSRLQSAMKPQLEQVFFFNQLQTKWRNEIRRVVAQYGVPEIIECGQEVMLRIRGSEQTQSLFVVVSDHPDRLLAVIVWGRFYHEEILVLHLAVDGAPFLRGSDSNSGAMMAFAESVNAFLKVAGRIAGIQRVRFAYWDRVIKLAQHPARRFDVKSPIFEAAPVHGAMLGIPNIKD